MPTTMSLIAKQTVGAGGAASVTFSYIPPTFTDLKLVASFRGTTAQVYEITALRFNGVNANLSSRTIEGSGSAASSLNNGYIYLGSGNGATSTANTFGSIEAYIPNYRSGNQKSVSIDAVGETNGTTIYMQLTAGLWNDVAQINTIEIVPTGSFVEYSEFTLYGISNSTTTQNPTTPSAIGGDIINTDGTYWYHQFLYSGTFTPLKTLTCELLVVAGGGGGGNIFGGGGGGGGLCYQASRSLTASTYYSASIGAGGSANTNGTNSIFDTVTANGGGGGARQDVAANDGGSGGGANYAGAGANIFGLATQGNSGGATGFGSNGGATINPSGVNYGAAGGGGGAGGVGGAGNTSTNAGGTGGIGKSYSISGTSITYAGGGGGSCQGGGTAGTASGGGGAGGAGTTGTVGTANRGGGGGGSGSGAGAAGGSGIIIVRYPV